MKEQKLKKLRSKKILNIEIIKFIKYLSKIGYLTKNLKIVQNAFDDEIIILSHSVDPEIDTVERLMKYQEINEIDGNNWFLLRGDIDEIIKMAQLGYFAIASVDNHVENSLIHTENIVLVDNQQRIRGVYNGTSELEMSYLIDDINRLLN